MTATVMQGQYAGTIIIPDSIIAEGHSFKVTEIFGSSFRSCNVDTVVLSNNISRIGERAFENSQLKSITLPDSITYLGFDVFRGCKSLKKIKLPDSLSSVPDNCFTDSGLEELSIPAKAEILGVGAFLGTALTTVVIPDNVKSLGSGCFRDCEKLTDVVLGTSMTEINLSVFENTALKNLKVPSNIKSITQKAIKSSNPDFKIEIEESDEPLEVVYINSYYASSIESCDSLVINREITFKKESTPYCETVKHLIVGNKSRGENSLCIKNPSELESLTIGPYFQFSLAYRYSMSEFSGLSMICINSNEPPVCPKFSDKQLMTVKIMVPVGALETYKNADGWKSFWNIEESDKLSGVSEIISDTVIKSKEECGRYDLSGCKVSGDYRGVVVVKYTDGSTDKVLQQ